MGFERNPMKSYRELDKPRLTSRYILLVFVKQTKHSKWHLSFCQFEWWRGDSRVIVSRTRQPHFTSRYNFLSKNTCLPRNAGRLEVTLKQHFVSSRDFIGFERNPMKSYRELDNAILLLDTIFYRKTPAYQGTQAGSKWHWSNTLSVRVMERRQPSHCIENST
jgi:hypothetical protein